MAQGRPILVTGAAGFIGSHVSGALLSAGHTVVGIDNFDPFYDETLKRSNVAQLLAEHDDAASSRFELAETDIRDSEAMTALFQRTRPVAVVHLAAKAGVRPSIEDPIGYTRTNVHGTMVLLEAARRAGCDRMVIASSSSVYGNDPIVPFSEDHDVSNPISPYAATKKSCELLAHMHWHLTGMPTACLRFFTVFGPRQRPDLAICKFMRLMREGQPIPMFGDGSMSRDYTYIDDIVAGVLSALERIDRHGYRVWNLGGSHPISLSSMISAIGRITGVEPRIDRKPTQPGDVERTYADLTRSRQELDYRPGVTFEDGLARQWDWLARQ